jgi:hypothetical protein
MRLRWNSGWDNGVHLRDYEVLGWLVLSDWVGEVN